MNLIKINHDTNYMIAWNRLLQASSTAFLILFIPLLLFFYLKSPEIMRHAYFSHVQMFFFSVCQLIGIFISSQKIQNINFQSDKYYFIKRAFACFIVTITISLIMGLIAYSYPISLNYLIGFFILSFLLNFSATGAAFFAVMSFKEKSLSTLMMCGIVVLMMCGIAPISYYGRGLIQIVSERDEHPNLNRMNTSELHFKQKE